MFEACIRQRATMAMNAGRMRAIASARQQWCDPRPLNLTILFMGM